MRKKHRVHARHKRRSKAKGKGSMITTHHCMACSYCKTNCPICQTCSCRGLGFSHFTTALTEEDIRKKIREEEKAKLRLVLYSMSKAPKLYAITKEAFVATVEAYLWGVGIETLDIYKNAFYSGPLKNTPDLGRAKEEPTTEFAEKVIGQAFRLLEG